MGLFGRHLRSLIFRRTVDIEVTLKHIIVSNTSASQGKRTEYMLSTRLYLKNLLETLSQQPRTTVDRQCIFMLVGRLKRKRDNIRNAKHVDAYAIRAHLRFDL